MKVKARLARRHPGWLWPAASTIGELFRREGLTARRKRRRRTPPGGVALRGGGAERRLEHRLQGLVSHRRRRALRHADRRGCVQPLPDALQGGDALDGEPSGRSSTPRSASTVYRRVCATTTGRPFATTGAGGLTRLWVRMIKAGVGLERITPGKPQENGRLERLHRTLKEETASQPAASLRGQAERFGPSGGATTRSGRTPPSATPLRQSATRRRRDARTAACARQSPRPARCGG